MKTVKEMIFEILVTKDETQQTLAKSLNVNKSQVSRWLNGAVPKIQTQRKIKQLYDNLMKTA